MRVSVHDCVANLTLTQCGATVKALDDCAQAMVHACPSEESRCSAYLSECDQTIVVRPPDSGTDCRLRIQ
jgi:hypothetical protein